MQHNFQTLFRTLSLSLFLVFLGQQSNFITIAEAGCRDTAEPGVVWNNCRKRNLIISGLNLENSDLSHSDFSATDLRESNLSGANLNKSTLLRTTLAGSKAVKANFNNILSYRANFENTDFTEATFNKAELQRANFKNANLTRVSFIKADLGRAKFHDAVLTDNDFDRANLSRVDFSKAKIEGKLNLENAFFLQTYIEGVDLTNTTGLEQWQINMACGNEKTILPTGLNMPQTWPCVPDKDE